MIINTELVKCVQSFKVNGDGITESIDISSHEESPIIEMLRNERFCEENLKNSIIHYICLKFPDTHITHPTQHKDMLAIISHNGDMIVRDKDIKFSHAITPKYGNIEYNGTTYTYFALDRVYYMWIA